jgi:NAD(P)-dependent dehydrogenase (short-subunit alcohol dehydrogenase family)
VKLDGKIALITGGTSGIGLATVRLFLAEGARLAVTGRDAERLAVVAEEVGERGMAFHADVLDGTARSELFAAIKDRFGRLDIVFANAGMVKTGAIAEMSEATFDQILRTNVTAVFLTVQAALPLLGPGASIILNGSVAAGQGLFPGAGAYAASKAAVTGMGQAMAAELAQRRIRLNILVPGLIKTPLWGQHLLAPEAAAAREQRWQQRVPLDRWGEATEIAKAVLFLASDDSSYVSGVELVVDGGLTGATYGAPLYRA